MVLRKAKLTLSLIAGVLGFGCAHTMEGNEHSKHLLKMAQHRISDHDNSGRRLSKGVSDAIDEHVKRDIKMVFFKYEGLFYKAGFDRDGDGIPDVYMMGRWMFETDKDGIERKVPTSDFALICHVKLGDNFLDTSGKVVYGNPDITCGYVGRKWVDPGYIYHRMAGVDVYTTPRMRKEK